MFGERGWETRVSEVVREHEANSLGTRTVTEGSREQGEGGKRERAKRPANERPASRALPTDGRRR